MKPVMGGKLNTSFFLAHFILFYLIFFFLSDRQLMVTLVILLVPTLKLPRAAFLGLLYIMHK